MSLANNLADALQAITHTPSEPHTLYTGSTQAITLDYTRSQLAPEHFQCAQQILQENALEQHIEDMFCGKAINATEDRPVLHTALRASPATRSRDLSDDQTAIFAKIDQQLSEFNSQHDNSTLTDIVCIGIGGSQLSLDLLYHAFREKSAIKIHFVANIDPAALRQVLANITLSTSWFFFLSKSFAGSEIHWNVKTLLQHLDCDDFSHMPQQHLPDTKATLPRVFACTSAPEKAQAYGIAGDCIYTFPESIGGRFSSWSTLALPLVACFGYPFVADYLAGARAMDDHFRTTPYAQNLPVMAAIIDFWHYGYLHKPHRVLLPYSEHLAKLIVHIQQLEMESLGKKGGSTPICPAVWGQVGSRSEHAIGQWLHQSSQPFCVEFISILHATENLAQHQTMLRQMLAQAAALSAGVRSTNPHKNCSGAHPSTLLMLSDLSPFSLGQLLSFYEHKVTTLGYIYNINAYDQMGVELGKQLATQLARGQPESVDITTQMQLKYWNLAEDKSHG